LGFFSFIIFVTQWVTVDIVSNHWISMVWRETI